MPDKATWCGRLDEVTTALRSLPDPWVDRRTLETLLGIGRRRAQQILAPCVGRQIGGSGVADREAVIAHLRRLATGEASHYESLRRRRLAAQLDGLQRERRVLVEAPASVVNQDIEGLPAGVSIAPGKITVEFDSPRQALERLLALAMAIGNDPLLFERLVTGSHSAT
jgi:hypothetical protein